MARRRTRNQRANASRPLQLVNDMFRVHDLTKRVRFRDLPYFTVTLTNRSERYDAIAGPPAAKLTVGMMVHIHGCFLLRRGEPALVLCSLKPINQSRAR